MNITPKTLDNITNKYIEQVQNDLDAYPRLETCRYRHVAINLLNIMTTASMLFGIDSVRWANQKEIYVECLMSLKRYFYLLNNFPAFKEAEFSTQEGFFSDIPLAVFPEELRKLNTDSISMYYVQEAYKRLFKR